MIQLKQLSTAYEAKSALTLSKQMLKEEMTTEDIPAEGIINTSVGEVVIKRTDTEDAYTFTLTLTTTSGEEYLDDLQVNILETEENLEESEEEPQVEEESLIDP